MRIAIVAFAVLAAVLYTGFAFAGEPAEKNDYVCKICYEPVPADKVACETLVAPTLEGVNRMILAAAKSLQQGADRMTIECSFPEKTERGYTGYRAVVDMKK